MQLACYEQLQHKAPPSHLLFTRIYIYLCTVSLEAKASPAFSIVRPCGPLIRHVNCVCCTMVPPPLPLQIDANHSVACVTHSGNIRATPDADAVEGCATLCGTLKALHDSIVLMCWQQHMKVHAQAHAPI